MDNASTTGVVNYVYDSTKSLFTDATKADFSLADDSQAIDLGDNYYVTTEVDVIGNKRIVNEIVDELDTEQLRELTRFKDNSDDAGLQRWLIENVPDLDKIVEEEMAILLGEIAENSELFT